MAPGDRSFIPVPPPTAIGAAAIVMWSSMALLSSLAGHLPPLQLLSMTFSVATLLVLARCAVMRANPLKLIRQPPLALGVGVGAFFGYHLLFFVAMQNAPVIEASLINYLWPLLIVLLSSRSPGSRTQGRHLLAGALGLLGTYVLLTGGGGLSLNGHLVGYLAAGGAAITWAGYSVFNRRFRNVPTEAVGAYCAATALLAWVAHLALEPTVMPQGIQWLAILGMGLGPVGAAFFAWDVGVKHGNLRALGTLSYAAPLLSSLLLILAGRAAPTPSVLWACLLIVAGGVLGTMESDRLQPA